MLTSHSDRNYPRPLGLKIYLRRINVAILFCVEYQTVVQIPIHPGRVYPCACVLCWC
jgi:hypothetical protein